MVREIPNSDPPGFCNGPSEAADSSGINNNFNGARADHMPIQHTLLSDSSFSFGSMHEPPHSDTHETLLAGLDSGSNVTQSNGFQNSQSQIDNNFIDINSIPVDTPMQVFPCSGERLNDNCESDMYKGIVYANNLVNDSTHLNNFHNPQNYQNFISTRGNHMTSQSGDINDSILRLPIGKNTVSCGANAPVSCNSPDSRILGIGKCMKATPGCSVPIRENTRGSKWTTPSLLDTSTGQKAYRNFLNPGHDIPGGLSSFQSNVSGFSGLARNEDDWTSSNNKQRFKTGSYGLSSSPSQNLQTQEVDMRHCIPMPNNRSLVLGGSMDTRSLNTDAYMGIQGYLAAASRPFSASQGHQFDYGQVRLPGLTSESAHATRTNTRQSYEQLQRYLKSYRDLLPNSSLISPSIGAHRSSNRQDQLGQEIPAFQGSSTQGPEGDHFPNRIEVPSARQRFPAGVSNASQVVEGGLSLRRMGVPLASNLWRPQDSGPHQHFNDLTTPAFSVGQVIPSAMGNIHPQAFNILGGQPQKSSSHQTRPVNSVNFRSLVPSNYLGPTSSTGPVIPAVKGSEVGQASSARVASSLKRKASRPPQGIPRVQRIKTTPLPSTLPSLPTADQNAPSIKTSPAHYIKRQGSDKLPPVPKTVQMGVKCPLCKNDLSYKSYAPVCLASVPTVLPEVAVLPCGHVFHDHCLKLITPEDQLKDPPCIPCAIGES